MILIWLIAYGLAEIVVPQSCYNHLYLHYTNLRIQLLCRLFIWINILIKRYFYISGQLILHIFEGHKEANDKEMTKHRFMSQLCIRQGRYVSDSSFLSFISSEVFIMHYAWLFGYPIVSLLEFDTKNIFYCNFMVIKNARAPLGVRNGDKI